MARFSIILPVKNGGVYIKDCINSILSQSFADFELLILENQSTDGTTEWLNTIKDSRVKIFPAQQPLSIEDNWKRITAIPKNEFMTLIGHDDMLNENFLSTINELIEKFPDASLYHTNFSYINASGQKIRSSKTMPEKQTAGDFLETFLKSEVDVMGTGYMMRSKDYDQIGGIPLYPNLLFADFELWIGLTQLNYKITSPLECFSFRVHQSTTTISSDIKYWNAFDRFISYLVKLKTDYQFEEKIQENAAGFLFFYCRGLCHRLLRTPKKKRDNLTVSKLILKFKEYAKDLGIEKAFKPEKVFSIRLARIIDSNSVLRLVFLSFKKIFPKPILK